MSMSSFSHIVSEPTNQCSENQNSKNTVIDESYHTVDTLRYHVKRNEEVSKNTGNCETDTYLIDDCKYIVIEEVSNEIRYDDRNISNEIPCRSFDGESSVIIINCHITLMKLIVNDIGSSWGWPTDRKQHVERASAKSTITWANNRFASSPVFDDAVTAENVSTISENGENSVCQANRALVGVLFQSFVDSLASVLSVSFVFFHSQSLLSFAQLPIIICKFENENRKYSDSDHNCNSNIRISWIEPSILWVQIRSVDVWNPKFIN